MVGWLDLHIPPLAWIGLLMLAIITASTVIIIVVVTGIGGIGGADLSFGREGRCEKRSCRLTRVFISLFSPCPQNVSFVLLLCRLLFTASLPLHGPSSSCVPIRFLFFVRNSPYFVSSKKKGTWRGSLPVHPLMHISRHIWCLRALDSWLGESASFMTPLQERDGNENVNADWRVNHDEPRSPRHVSL